MASDSHQPNSSNQTMLPGWRNKSGAEDGEEWSALLALRTTDRDFLYSAGFQMGRPKGWLLFIAYAMIRDVRWSNGRTGCLPLDGLSRSFLFQCYPPTSFFFCCCWHAPRPGDCLGRLCPLGHLGLVHHRHHRLPWYHHCWSVCCFFFLKNTRERVPNDSFLIQKKMRIFSIWVGPSVVLL